MCPSIIQAKDIAKDIVVYVSIYNPGKGYSLCPSIIQAKDIVVLVSIYNPGKGYSGICVHL